MTEYPEYDFASRVADVGKYKMHYVDEGSGETLLFLHGNPTWSFLYRHFIAALREQCRCVAPDHLGFGFSEKPYKADYSMAAHIERLGVLIDQLGLRDITLVAQDWGGIIGLGWAVAHKPMVKRLVLLNTAAFLPEGPLERLKIRPLAVGFPFLWSLKIPVFGELFVQGLNGFARYVVPAGVHHRERLDKKTMKGYLDPYPTWGSRRAQLESVRQIPILSSHPAARLLKRIDGQLTGWEVPTQLIWGMKDPIFVPWFLEQFEKRLPNHAPSLRIPDASHFLQDDTPEIIIQKIREFLKSS